MEVGGRKALLTHVYNAHTDGDTWVFFDDANVLDTGDTFTNTGRYNTIDFANGGDIRGLIRAVDAYLKVANDQTKIVPGHGALANKANLVAWREMLVTSRDRIQKLVNEGKTEQDVLAAKPLADLDAKWAANDAAGPELDPHGLQLVQAVVTTAPGRKKCPSTAGNRWRCIIRYWN